MTFLNYFVSKTLEKSEHVDCKTLPGERGWIFPFDIRNVLVFLHKCQIFSIPNGGKDKEYKTIQIDKLNIYSRNHSDFTSFTYFNIILRLGKIIF